jgi:hypothetical protein
LRGASIVKSRDEVLDSARSLLKSSPERAAHFEVWYLPVDGHRVAVKELVSELTGLPVAAFRTGEAIRVLAELGLVSSRVD